MYSLEIHLWSFFVFQETVGLEVSWSLFQVKPLPRGGCNFIEMVSKFANHTSLRSPPPPPQAEDTDLEEGPLGGEGAVSGGWGLPVALPGTAVQPQEWHPMQRGHARRGPLRSRPTVCAIRKNTCNTCCRGECLSKHVWAGHCRKEILRYSSRLKLNSLPTGRDKYLNCTQMM